MKARCGSLGHLRYRTGAGSLASQLPDRPRDLVRRTPLRYLARPFERQRARASPWTSGPPNRCRPIGAGRLLTPTARMLDELGGFDEQFRLYGDDIELGYRAAKAGWERWYVPQAVVTHRYAAEIDRKLLTRHTLWHWRGILRFVRKHPERLRAF